MALEIEIKFSIAEGQFQTVADWQPLVEMTSEGPKQKRLVSTYYDTPDLTLQKNKAAFRLRRKGDALLQTVKAEVGLKDGLATREEIEFGVQREEPDFQRLQNTPFGHLFQPPLTEQLKPLFVTDFERIARILVLKDGTRVEMALDKGEVRAGDKSTPILELELELLDGSSESLMQLGNRLEQALPITRATDSKAKRGYDLVNT